MAVSRRRLAKALVTLAALAALAAPAALALALGWIEIHFTAWNEEPGPDPTSVEVWVLLALAYVVWAPLVMAGMALAFDRLGYRFVPVEREPRPSAKERRRLRAGLGYLASREAPPAGAPQARPKRGAGSSSSRGADPPGPGEGR